MRVLEISKTHESDDMRPFLGVLIARKVIDVQGDSEEAIKRCLRGQFDIVDKRWERT